MNVAINGLGRIGRAAMKQILDESELNLVGVNDLIPAANLAYLLNYDTVYGRYKRKVEADADGLRVDGRMVPLFHEKDPSLLPWKKLGVGVVFECTGAFRKREDLVKHLVAGAHTVILSAPAKGDDIGTVVHGVNTATGDGKRVISCASCTTNCIAPVMEVMNRRIGVRKAVMTTIHAYTSSQGIVDGPNKQFRRGRAAAANLVPTSTGAAIAATQALPELKGKFDGAAVRAPVPVGSIADIVLLTSRATSVSEVNAIFREESKSERYRGILDATEDPIVSSDIIGRTEASTVDLAMTQVVDGDLVKVMSWYDNEWGYTHQMLLEALQIARAQAHHNG
ncbi:MAG: type I glyceraldehyde-3-phosphate dehydrogenase [Bryobacterales bacterium]|nr:type I glyceraldehyde-3-phosphate dehydrogenase [Bryobacterales bacterium]